MNLTKLVLSAAGGYIVGTFPTRDLAARMAAGRQDVKVSDVDPKATATRVATVAAVLAKVGIACVGGLRLAGPVGLAVAGGASVAGDRFPFWRFLKGRRDRPAVVSG